MNLKPLEDMIETIQALRLGMLGAKVFTPSTFEDLFMRLQPELEQLLAEAKSVQQLLVDLQAEVQRLEKSQKF